MEREMERDPEQMGSPGERPESANAEAAGEVVALRAHHLLCAQGFQGLGYSKAFAENFAAVLEGLRRRTQTLVQTVDRPDVLCGPCPHLGIRGQGSAASCPLTDVDPLPFSEGRCQRGGPESESKVRETDHRVLGRLGLSAGAQLSWEELLRRIGSRIGANDLPAICGPCPWISRGHCAMGLSRLHGHSFSSDAHTRGEKG